MNELAKIIEHCPHLLSPAALAKADTNGKWEMGPHLEVINQELMDMAFSQNGRLMVNVPFRHGKAITESEMVPTPAGWKHHGDLKVGDELYAPDGKTIAVEAVGEKVLCDCEVVFEDGKVKCHENHEWPVFDQTGRRPQLKTAKFAGIWGILETKFIEYKSYKFDVSRDRIMVGGIPATPDKLRNIIGVNRIKPEWGNCIQVTDGKYIVGENLVPTHNSWLCSHYFPAWMLLLFPETRIVLITHTAGFAANFGSKVKEVIEKFGAPHGIVLKRDTKSKSEWAIKGHDGGLLCRGTGGKITGRPCDLLVIDDPIGDAKAAMSTVQLESIWDWFSTSAFSRLSAHAPIVIIMTRWCPEDLCGKLEQREKNGGEKWRKIKFKAIADDNDILGRKAGEALWPKFQPLARLEGVRHDNPRWFAACWQQEPLEGLGFHFRPLKTKDSDGWPIYDDHGDYYILQRGVTRTLYQKNECQTIIAIDLAMGKRKDSDYTSFVTGVLTLDGQVLILDVLNERIRHEDNAKRLDVYCELWKPDIVVSDDDMLSAAITIEARRHYNIPEIRQLPTKNARKLVRAQAAIIRGENGRIWLPRTATWMDAYCTQLSAFTGEDDKHDDMVDATGVLCRIVDSLKPQAVADDYSGAEVFAEGKADTFSTRSPHSGFDTGRFAGFF